MTVAPNPQQKELARIIARAWADEGFKSRLLREPAQVLKEYGMSVPDGMEVRVVENTDKVLHFVLPARPAEELSEEQLENVAAAGSCHLPPACLCFSCW